MNKVLTESVRISVPLDRSPPYNGEIIYGLAVLIICRDGVASFQIITSFKERLALHIQALSLRELCVLMYRYSDN